MSRLKNYPMPRLNTGYGEFGITAIRHLKLRLSRLILTDTRTFSNMFFAVTVLRNQGIVCLRLEHGMSKAALLLCESGQSAILIPLDGQTHSHLRLIASQNEDRFLEAKWSHLVRGWLNYRTNGIHLAAFVVAVGRDSCRIGVVAQGWATQSMPQWLVRMATNIVLPQLFRNIENEAVRRVEERKPKEMPREWYGRWYEALRRFFNGM